MPPECDRSPTWFRRPDPRRAILAAGLSVLVLAIYWQVTGYPLVRFDDGFYVGLNPAVREGVTLKGVRWAFTATLMGNWHPLAWISHMADVSLFGMAAGRFHLVNLLFHLANTLLLFRVFLRMTGRTWESGLVAALFAVHPLHVESVAWISERKDLLCAFFWLLAINAYAGYAARPGVARYLAVFSCFILALLSKAMAVTLPFALLLLDYWPLGRFLPSRAAGEGAEPPFVPASARRILLEKVPMLLLSALFSLIAIQAQSAGDAIGSLDRFPFRERLVNAVAAYGNYVLKTAWPSKLAVFYPFPASGRPLREAAVSAAILLGLTAAAIFLRRRRWPVVGWCWFLGTLVPVIGLVQVGGQSMADRYSYIPSIGLSVMAAWGGCALVERFRLSRPAASAAAGLWVAALSACAFVQAGYWRGSLPLFEHALAVTSGNWIAHAIVGAEASEAGRDEEALRHLREALRLRPDYADAHESLGMLLARQGRHAAAVPHFLEVVRYRPEDVRAQGLLAESLEKSGRSAEADAHRDAAIRDEAMGTDGHRRLGMLLAGEGRLHEALAHFRAALRLGPSDPEIHYDMGVALGRLGRREEALRHFREAISMPVADAEGHNKVGLALARLGRSKEALSHFREALRSRPDDVEALYDLGAVLEQAGRREEAIQRYREAARLAPGDADTLLALAMALDRSGRQGEASALFEEVLRLRPDDKTALERLSRRPRTGPP